MNQIQAALTTKYAGLPGIAWAGIVAVGAWLILPRLRGAAGATGKAGAPGKAGTYTAGSVPGSTQATTDYSLGYAQGVQAGNTPPAVASVPSPAQAPAQAGPWRHGPIPVPPAGYVVQATPNPSAADRSWDVIVATVAQPFNPHGSYWLPGTPDASNWAWRLLPDPAGAGVGGPSLGSRSASLWAGHHPSLRAVPLRAHWVRAQGGASHGSEVARVAAQAGLHPARLLALNPRATGFIRVA